MTDAMLQLAAWSLWAFGLVLFAAQMLAREIGFRLGRWRAPNEEREGVGLLTGALLGLLAFVLALTLSFANTRFAERRAGTLAEANAIGTAWLRAQAIDHPRAAEIARLLDGYTTLRADFIRVGLEPERLDALTLRSGEVQAEIWGHLAALVRERPDPVVASLMTSLNEAFDAATAERFAFSFRMPASLAWLLVGLAVVSMAAIGYQLGLRGRGHGVLCIVLIGVWTLVIVQILDLGAARVGAVRAGAEAYEWTQQGFRGGITIPPLPR
jgi:hypothetical protein